MQAELEQEKTPLSISDKATLFFGWTVILCFFIKGCFNVHLLISGGSNNVSINILNAIFDFLIVFLFVKSDNERRLLLSKGYQVLGVFLIMFFSIVYLYKGNLKDINDTDFLVLLIMLLGISLIVFLYRRLFSNYIHMQWQIDKRLPPFRASHQIHGNRHIIRIEQIDEDDE